MEGYAVVEGGGRLGQQVYGSIPQLKIQWPSLSRYYSLIPYPLRRISQTPQLEVIAFLTSMFLSESLIVVDLDSLSGDPTTSDTIRQGRTLD
jgi:hypothetical protein